MCIDENALCGGPDPRYIEILRKRAEILSKLTNGVDNYHTHALYQKVVDSLARGADPVMIIEQLLDIDIDQSERMLKMWRGEPLQIKVSPDQLNEILKTIE